LTVIGILCFSAFSILHFSSTASEKTTGGTLMFYSPGTPFFSDPVVSNSFPLGGQSVTISVSWTVLEGTFGTLMFYANNTGMWTLNQTYNPKAVSSYVWNITLRCNTTGGCYVQWQEWANSSAGYSNQTSVQNLYVWLPLPSISSQSLGKTAANARSAFFLNGTHMVDYTVYQNTSTVPWHFSVAAYDLNCTQWYYFDTSITSPSDTHWQPVVSATPNETLIIIWTTGSPGAIRYMLSTYTANSTNNTQTLISNWGRVQNVSSSVDSVGAAGGAGGDMYLDPLWFKNDTIIMDYVRDFTNNGTFPYTYWEAELHYNDTVGWYGDDSTIFINGASSVSASVYWSWYYDTQGRIMGGGHVLYTSDLTSVHHFNVYFVYSSDQGKTWNLANSTSLSTPIGCARLQVASTYSSETSSPILDENGNIIIPVNYFAYPTDYRDFGYEYVGAGMCCYNATPGSASGVWTLCNFTDAQSGNPIQGWCTGDVGMILDGYYKRPAFWTAVNGSQIYYIRIPNSFASFLAIFNDTSQSYCLDFDNGVYPSDSASASYSFEFLLRSTVMPIGNYTEPHEYTQDVSSTMTYGCLYTATQSATITSGAFYFYCPTLSAGLNFQIGIYYADNMSLLGNSDCSIGIGSGYIYGFSKPWTGWGAPAFFSQPLNIVAGKTYYLCVYLNHLGNYAYFPAFVYDNTTSGETVAFSTLGGFPSTITSPIYYNWSWDIALFASCSYLKGFNGGQLSATIAPSSTSLGTGDSTIFNAIVSGGKLAYTYQWYVNDTQQAIGTDYDSWNFTPEYAGSYTIYCTVTDGIGNQATSNVAIASVYYSSSIDAGGKIPCIN